MAGRETVTLRLLLPPPDHLPPVLVDHPGVVLHQHPAQHADRGKLPQPRRGGRVADRFHEPDDRPGPGRPGGRGRRPAVVITADAASWAIPAIS
jgi:hypothetical protein